jgi:hypothetical protein
MVIGNTYEAETDTEDKPLADHKRVKVGADACETLSKTDTNCT